MDYTAPGGDSRAILGDGSLSMLSLEDFLAQGNSLAAAFPAPLSAAASFATSRAEFPVCGMQHTSECAPYNDPLELCRQRRRSGTDNPETWDPMASDFVEVPLDLSAASLSAECRTVLEGTFKSCFRHTTPSSVSGLVECIADKSNYQVLSITRLQNFARYSMHKHFGRSYGIASVRQVYHGTATDSARTIAKMGFRNAASQRAKFGKGIYAAANVWEALAYAQPETHSLVQTFLVADLWQGPSRVGHENMIDFGQNASAKQILTTTNPEETIFCAAYEDQLYAHYSVTVRCTVEQPHSLTAYNTVHMYHPSIWSLLKQQNITPPTVPKSVFAVPLPPRASAVLPRVRQLKSHMNFKISDTVRIVKTLKNFTFCCGEVGHINRIVKDGHVHFCIEFDSLDLQERIKLVNRTPHYEWQNDLPLSWLRCQISHIEMVTSPTPISTASAGSGASPDTAKDAVTTQHDSSADSQGAQRGAKRKMPHAFEATNT